MPEVRKRVGYLLKGCSDILQGTKFSRNFAPFCWVWQKFGEIFKISRTWDEISSKYREIWAKFAHVAPWQKKTWLYFANPPRKGKSKTKFPRNLRNLGNFGPFSAK
jgi:hypothetical protein